MPTMTLSEVFIIITLVCSATARVYVGDCKSLCLHLPSALI